MKTFTLILSLVLSSAAFAADGGCKIGIDTENMNDAQMAVVQKMAKKLEKLGCKIGSPESQVTAAPSSVETSPSTGACSVSGQVLTAQYGCVVPSGGSCMIPGTNSTGIIYNNSCVAIGNSAPAAPGYPSVEQGACSPGTIQTQAGCLAQGVCSSGFAFGYWGGYPYCFKSTAENK